MICNDKRLLPGFLAVIISLASACDTSSDTSAGPSGTTAPRVAESAANNEQSAAENTGAPGAEVERAVVAERLPYAEVDEHLVYGHFAFPADMVDPLPGIIVIHERWGLDDGVREQADRIAAQGYVVLAVDLYGGKTATDIASARPLMVDVVENSEQANDNIRQAYQFLIESGQAPAIGVLGWSFGGGWALNTALLLPEDIDAAVIYYGQVTDNQSRLEPLNVPILGLFGEKDRGVTVDMVRRFESALKTLGKDFEIEVFPGVGHAFADPAATTYDADAAEKAWLLVMAFFNLHLVQDAE